MTVILAIGCTKSSQDKKENKTSAQVSKSDQTVGDFTKIKWGMSAEELKKTYPQLVNATTPGRSKEIWKIEKPNFLVEGAQPSNITFIFNKGKVYEAFIKIDTKSNPNLITTTTLSSLEKKLGEPTSDKDGEAYRKIAWKKDGMYIRWKTYKVVNDKVGSGGVVITFTNLAIQSMR
jgi:hypothetical protein